LTTKNKIRIILNYEGTMWYEIEGENMNEVVHAIDQVERSSELFQKVSKLMNTGFKYFEEKNVAHITTEPTVGERKV
jgi:hypothetical protein